jgi:Fe-S cluster assembly protein SufD
MMTLNNALNSDPFVSLYTESKSLLDGLTHTVLGEKRDQAIRQYTEFGIPTVRDEEFKYLPLHVLNESNFKFGYGAHFERSQLSELQLGEIDAYTFVFVNGQFAPEASSMVSMPDGLEIDVFENLDADSLASIGSIATLQGKLGSTNDERFVALNTSFLSEGLFIRVAKSKTIEKPIHFLHVVTTDEAILSTPRIWVELAENAEATLIESYQTLRGRSFTCPVTEIKLAASARFEHLKYQDESLEAVHIANIAVHQESQSVYTSNNVNFGGHTARNDINVWVNGEYTETWLNSANVGTESQIIDNHTRIDHAKPNCQSFEVYKTILKDKSEGVFNGKIFVYEDAQKTDAKQTNQALLLSPNATMNTKPQLEIFADDVKCTHGATIGQLREDALFYLRARGVEKSKAEALLVYAFAAEVIEKIGSEDVRVALESRLFEKLA